MLRRSPSPTRTQPSHVPDAVNASLGAPGAPLEAGTRIFMQTRLGHDFGAVRVHTDERAAESALATDALAYTVGNHIVFGAARFGRLKIA